MSILRPARARSGLAVATLLGVGALALSGCSSTGDASAADTSSTSAGDSAAADVSGTLTLYTSEPEDKADAVIAAFTKEHPHVKVTLFRAGTGDLNARVAAEQKAGKIGADLLWAADAGTFDGYAAQGVLQKFTPSDAGEIDKDVVDPDGYWVGTRIIPTVIAYNTTQVKTPPTSWADLADPQWAGKITMPNPDVSGAAAYNAAVWFSTSSLGQDWFTKLGANKPVIADSNGPVSQAVASGTQPVGVVVDYLVRDLAAQGSPIAVSYPSEGVPYVAEPIGIFKDAANVPAAQAFEEFVISKTGQELAVQQNYLPVRTDVGTPAGAPALSSLTTLAGPSDLATVQPQAVDAFKTAMG